MRIALGVAVVVGLATIAFLSWFFQVGGEPDSIDVVHTVASDHPGNGSLSGQKLVGEGSDSIQGSSGISVGREPIVSSLVPWDRQVLEAQPQDMWGTPLAPKSYLHAMLNNNSIEAYRAGTIPAPYRLQIESLIDRLPQRFREDARRRQSELAKAIESEVGSVRDLEIAHWEQRYLDYHKAVEAGHVIVVDNNEVETHKAAERNGEALKAANLGVMNRDFFYITSSGRSLDGKMGNYSNLIYLRRSDYPESFALFDAIQDAHSHAEAIVRNQLGVPR
ncbi:MAG: hypothetical protein JNK15_02105 [Planctomycetes bacterium]|nr:hypothetical protein [Planctomycetota bacterium]